MPNMDVIRKFDPWGDPLCTCPPKYSFSPYTGCSHRCAYCYITSYIPNAFNCRPKKDLLKRVKKDVSKVDLAIPISISNSSDPYPPEEKDVLLTRRCLEIFRDKKCRVLLITKSDLVLRDLDLLREMDCVVSFTITTLDQDIAKKLEPHAPLAKARLDVIRRLSKKGIPCTVRADPVIPLVNEREMRETIRLSAEAGARHITASTFKPRADSWRRLSVLFPKASKELRRLYFGDGQRRRNAWYLPARMRREIMQKIKETCDENHISFASCREGFGEMSTGESCDGSHLLR
ncbi:MAG: radical SAM protein [Methanocellales archaeon]|nr:radical SAM protein [Methanocellales archaeon]